MKYKLILLALFVFTTFSHAFAGESNNLSPSDREKYRLTGNVMEAFAEYKLMMDEKASHVSTNFARSVYLKTYGLGIREIIKPLRKEITGIENIYLKELYKSMLLGFDEWAEFYLVASELLKARESNDFAAVSALAESIVNGRVKPLAKPIASRLALEHRIENLWELSEIRMREIMTDVIKMHDALTNNLNS